MILTLLLVPFLGSVVLFAMPEENSAQRLLLKQVALIISMITFMVSILLWILFDASAPHYQFIYQVLSVSSDTEGQIGPYNAMSLSMGIDSLSLFFIMLTTFITPVCILSNWNDINKHLKSYLISFLVLEFLQLCVFVVLDLLLFYIFFESVLIPLFLIVGIWGSGISRIRSSFMLFLYTLFGSLWMLLSIMVLYSNYGSTDFQFIDWSANIDFYSQKWLWWGFFISFAFKTPLFPFHIWLPWAHASAPLGGSIILAAVILKLATYGFMRILIPIFPESTDYFGPVVQVIAVITLIYASLATIRATDTKGIVALSSVCHVSVIIFGLFSNSLIGIEGAYLLAIAHGFVSPALFICVGGIIYQRYHNRSIFTFKGLVQYMPIFTALFFFFSIANAGVPLTFNFVGEFLALAGIYQLSPWIGGLASLGIFFSACYSLWLHSRLSYGKISENLPKPMDLLPIEFTLLFTLLIATVVFGVLPNVILHATELNFGLLLYSS